MVLWDDSLMGCLGRDVRVNAHLITLAWGGQLSNLGLEFCSRAAIHLVTLRTQSCSLSLFLPLMANG